VFEDNTLEEFDEDCRFPCRDLSHQSPRSAEEARFTYNFDDIDQISDQLGIPGTVLRINHSSLPQPTLGSNGTCPRFECHSVHQRRISTSALSQNGRHSLRMFSKTLRSFTGKLLHACLVIPSGRAFLTGMETMLTTSTTVLLPNRPQRHCHRPGLVAICPPTALSQQSLSQPQSNYMTSVHSWMLVPGLASHHCGWKVESMEAHPGWQTLHDTVTLAGWRLLASNVSSATSLALAQLADTSKFTVTTKGLVEGWWNGRARLSCQRDFQTPPLLHRYQ